MALCGGREPGIAVRRRLTLTILCAVVASANADEVELLREQIEHDGNMRTYHVALPKSYAPEQTYWIIVTVHGGGGNGRTHFLAEGVREEVRETGFGAIVVSPDFGNDDPDGTRFPSLRDGEYLLVILDEVAEQYRVHPKVFITGFSRGAQFTHRFAYAHPDRVAAAAPCASGTWTTPEGHLLIEGVGEVADPRSFLSEPSNVEKAPERLASLFTDRVASAAGLPAAANANAVPFLVMCGSLDTRFEIAQRYAELLRAAEFYVETEWPRTPHGGKGDERYAEEFKKYPRRAIAFFMKTAGEME